MTTPGEHRIECGLAAILAAKFIALLGGAAAMWPAGGVGAKIRASASCTPVCRRCYRLRCPADSAISSQEERRRLRPTRY